jgi:hypothetical protein
MVGMAERRGKKRNGRLFEMVTDNHGQSVPVKRGVIRLEVGEFPAASFNHSSSTSESQSVTVTEIPKKGDFLSHHHTGISVTCHGFFVTL